MWVIFLTLYAVGKPKNFEAKGQAKRGLALPSHYKSEVIHVIGKTKFNKTGNEICQA